MEIWHLPISGKASSIFATIFSELEDSEFRYLNSAWCVLKSIFLGIRGGRAELLLFIEKTKMSKFWSMEEKDINN